MPEVCEVRVLTRITSFLRIKADCETPSGDDYERRNMLDGLKRKLIRKLGGYTLSDVLTTPHPMKVEFSEHRMQTVKACHVIRKNVFSRYPDYMDHAVKEIAYKIVDELDNEDLIEYRSEEECPDLIRITAIVRAVAPTEVST